MERNHHRDYYIYVAFRSDGSPCYVGKGRANRWRINLRHSHNPVLRRIIEKAGGEIPFVVVRRGLSNDQAFEIEKAFVKAIGRFPNGPLVNMTDGGDGPLGSKQSAETIEKRVSKLRGIPRPPEVVEKVARASRGLKRSEAVKQKLRGPKSLAHRAALSVAAKNRKPQTPEQIEARVAPLRGKPRPPEVCAKISASKTGKKATPRTKAILRAANRSRDPEVRAKIRAGVLAANARRKAAVEQGELA